MHEVYGNLWLLDFPVKCITTNGTVKANGELVMGRGCALEAKQRVSWLPKELGSRIKSWGNRVFSVGYIANIDTILISFPVKNHWSDKADLDLIERSANQLVYMLRPELYNKFDRILLPCPGCGLGQRDWETEVKPILKDILNDRFTIISKRIY